KGLQGAVRLAERSVAVLNRGTPGCVVTPDGTLHLSLMRSCSAWPSGIWIDGDCRTAPDGSSFAWQHWSHTFEYALVSGPGDWRVAGFSLAAEDHNHDPPTVTTSPPSRHETGDSGRSDAVKPGAPRRVEDGAVFVDLPAFGTGTAALRAGSRGPAGAGSGTEPVQPVYTRYWLHGKGPAPAGNLPVAVHLSPVRVALPIPGPNPAEVTALTLTVGCGAEPASGTVELVVPGEVTVTASRDLRYDLAPGGYAAWDLTV